MECADALFVLTHKYIVIQPESLAGCWLGFWGF